MADIVAIDDDVDLLAIIVRAAEECGLLARSTTDAGAFKSMLSAGMPAMIIIDLQMPSCDGIELLRYLSEYGCRSRIILISGVDPRVLAIAKSVGEGLGLDMAEALQKPIRVAVLQSALTRYSRCSAILNVNMLRDSLRDGQLVLFYQPIVDLADSRLIGWEALARLKHPVHGLIGPEEFIPLAEREGAIEEVTQSVLEIAAKQLSEWLRSYGSAHFVSVNLSGASLGDLSLPDRLARICKKNDVSPETLCLELTETVAMGEVRQNAEILTRLRLKGFRLAIDDFGTGYSSLLQLHRLPFSSLKIDRSFIAGMAESEEANIIVDAIINLARSLKLNVVAEGVETPDLAARLTKLGCHAGQGYHFARPMPAEDVPEWLWTAQGIKIL